MEKYSFFTYLLSPIVHRLELFQNWQRKVCLYLLVVLLLMVTSIPASAAVEGILAKDSDGSYHQYCYEELLDSLTASLMGSSDALFEDFAKKEPVALLDSVNGYVDYRYVLEQYAKTLVKGEKFVLTDYTESEKARKAEVPAKVKLVSSAYGQLVRLEKCFQEDGSENSNIISVGGSDKDSSDGAKPEVPNSEQKKPDKEDFTDKDESEDVNKEINDKAEEMEDEKDEPKPKKDEPVPGPEKERTKQYSMIEGNSKIKLTRAQSWAESKNAHQRFIDIAPLYWEYGKRTGIRPEVLYAQAAYETGYGRYNGQVPASFNNWAGIKIGGSNGNETEDHEKFATPEDGVRGHYNHISAYLGLQPIGEPHDRYFSVKSIAWAGTVKYIEELSGKWAPSSEYHETIVRMISEMKQD